MKQYLIQRYKSFAYAFSGIGYFIRSQAHAQLHFLATVGVIGLGIYCRVSGWDWALLSLAMGLVWGLEAMNTALELVCDALHPERHPLIGRAKDVAAGAVLLGALAAVGVALAVFSPYFVGD
jgi:diacylglycerol kinase (ATP)